MAMEEFSTLDPQFAKRVQSSFAKQQIMRLLGATLTTVEPGRVKILLPFRVDLTQQHGFLHAGVLSTVVDSACGYAALSLMPAQSGVLSIEYKVNFLAPARSKRFLARGRVLRAGRTIIVCAGDVVAVSDKDEGEEVTVATMLATMLVVKDRPGIMD
jgi:uncharacterized protein (TIGR00369 family)